MRRKNSSHQQDIDDLKRQNTLLENQIRTLERARATGNFDAELVNVPPIKSESDESSENETDGDRRTKKLKPNTYVA